MTDTRTQGLEVLKQLLPGIPGRGHQPARRRRRRRTRRAEPRPRFRRAVDPPGPGSPVPQPGNPRRAHRAARQRRTEDPLPDRAEQRVDPRGDRRGDLPHDRLRRLPGGRLRAQARQRSAEALMLTLDQALEETRTGDLWLFRGSSRPDRAIQTLDECPGEPRRHDGGHRRLAAVDLACRTGRQARRHVDRNQSPWRAAQ